MKKKKLKIAIVSSYPPSEHNPSEYGYHLINHFRKKSLDYEKVILLSDRLPSKQEINFVSQPVPIENYQIWDFNGLTNPYKILKAAKASGADVVLFNLHLRSFGDRKLAVAVSMLTPFLTRISGIPTMVILHGGVPEVYANKGLKETVNGIFKSLLTRFMLSANVLGITTSKYVELLEKKYKAKNVALIPYGSFDVSTKPAFDLPEGALQVLVFGEMSSSGENGGYKKLEEIIEAVALIRSRTTLEIEIVIAGSDETSMSGYLGGIFEKYRTVRQLKFTSLIDLPILLRRSALCVFPYRYANGGCSDLLNQAASYGKALVIPKPGSLATWMDGEGYSADFYEPNSVKSLADSIQKVLENNEYRFYLSKRNYLAASFLPMEDMVDWYYLHFQKILA